MAYCSHLSSGTSALCDFSNSIISHFKEETKFLIMALKSNSNAVEYFTIYFGNGMCSWVFQNQQNQNIFDISYKLMWPQRSFKSSQSAKLQKKQCEGVCFGLYGMAYWMPIQQNLTPPVLLFSVFAGWGGIHFSNFGIAKM